MTGDDLRKARGTLGEMWGLGRPLTMTEMGKALGLKGSDPGATVRDYERSHTPISGPIRVAVNAMLHGYEPMKKAI